MNQRVFKDEDFRTCGMLFSDADVDFHLELTRSLWDGSAHPLLVTPNFSVRSFFFDSGVMGLRISSKDMEVTFCPWKGMQIWRFEAGGQDVTMKSTFEEPTDSTSFLENYGAFMLHCGLTGIGHPSSKDMHAHHGELPNGRMERVWIESRSLEESSFLLIGGSRRIRISHFCNLDFTVQVALVPSCSRMFVQANIENCGNNDFDYSYLCHINWRLPESGLLFPSNHFSTDFEERMGEVDGKLSADFLKRVSISSDQCDVVSKHEGIFPEYCCRFDIDDENNDWVESTMKSEIGTYAVAYRSREFGHFLRWISNTGDESAAGFCLPSTGSDDGRLANDEKGFLRRLRAGEKCEHLMCIGVN